MLEGSDAARRRLLDIETRRAACIDLREWADHANRAPHGRLERLRALDGDPLVEAGETQERRRLLIAIMEHCAQKKLPDEPLIRRVLAFHEASQPPARSTVEQIVIDWALRYDAGSNGERTTVSAPGTP